MDDIGKEIAYRTYKSAVYIEGTLEGERIHLGSDFLREHADWHRTSLLKVLLETQEELKLSRGIGVVSGDVELFVSDYEARKPRLSVIQGGKEIYIGRNFKRAFNKLLKKAA